MPEAAGANVTVPVPGFHDALVDAFVQVPETVQVSDPKAMYEAGAVMATFPETVALPEVDVSAPPLRVRLPITVSVFAPFVSTPDARVKDAAVSWDARLNVPVTVIAAKLLPAEMAMDLEAPPKATLDDPAAKLPEDTVDVFHEPATERVAPPMFRIAEAPEDVRSELNVTDAETIVSVPRNARAEDAVVDTPAFTVRL